MENKWGKDFTELKTKSENKITSLKGKLKKLRDELELKTRILTSRENELAYIRKKN